MQIRYDEDFLESAVFLCSSGKVGNISPLQIRRFQRDRERLYKISDPDERNSAFFKLHAEWFREWALDARIDNYVKQFPSLASELTLLAFRKARSKQEEGAELYVNSAGKNGVIALRVERLSTNEGLDAFMHHELMHLHDMVDRPFGYTRDLPAAIDPMLQRLIRDRYRLLWDVSIDGRLITQGKATIASQQSRRDEFDRAYSFWSSPDREQVFQRLWTTVKPTHAELLQLACDPRNVAQQHQPLPGALCPLCRFPTFEWADPITFKDEMLSAITRDFPTWRAQYGACKRCAEIYKAISKATQYNQPTFALS